MLWPKGVRIEKEHVKNLVKRKKNQIKKKSNKHKLRNQTGGLGFIRKILGVKPAKIEDNAIESLNDDLTNERAE